MQALKTTILKRLLIFLPLHLVLAVAYGQASLNCQCDGLVDPNFTESIPIYDYPKGRLVQQIRHNIKNEDYLVFTIDKDSAEYFHLMFSYAINGRSYAGWVRKGKMFGIYPRAYSDKLPIYSKPNNTADKSGNIAPGEINFLTILRCRNNWVFIKLNYKKTNNTGWLRKQDQCDNPYTTCN